MSLPNCNKTEVKKEGDLGWGVCATQKILKGEVIEEVPFILMPRYTTLGKNVYDMIGQTGFLAEKEKYLENLRISLKFKDPERFYFKWHNNVPLNGELNHWVVVPLGNACIYNTANCDNNIGWQIKEDTFLFRAERDIEAGEFLRSFYGYFVGNDGTVFNCETVFNLGLDYFNGEIKCKAVRFGSVESFEQAKQNPAFNRLAQLFQIAKNGLSIAKVSALLFNGEEKAAMDVPKELPSTILYQKITEFKNSPYPLVRIIFNYENKDDGSSQSEQIIFKK